MTVQSKKKHQLIGFLVLVLLGVVALPFLFQHSRPTADLRLLMTIPMPPPPSSMNLDLPISLDPVQQIKNTDQTLSTKSNISTEIAIQPKNSTGKPLLPVVPPAKPGSASPLSATLPKAWALKVATFIHPINARKLAQQLRSQGWDVYTRPGVFNKKLITQVFIGPEINYEKIKQIQEEIKKRFKFSGVVFRYHP